MRRRPAADAGGIGQRPGNRRKCRGRGRGGEALQLLPGRRVVQIIRTRQMRQRKYFVDTAMLPQHIQRLSEQRRRQPQPIHAAIHFQPDRQTGAGITAQPRQLLRGIQRHVQPMGGKTGQLRSAGKIRQHHYPPLHQPAAADTLLQPGNRKAVNPRRQRRPDMLNAVPVRIGFHHRQYTAVGAQRPHPGGIMAQCIEIDHDLITPALILHPLRQTAIPPKKCMIALRIRAGILV